MSLGEGTGRCSHCIQTDEGDTAQGGAGTSPPRRNVS